ncbi:hypothetical protein HanPSC8_Chr14g0641731 [Helianthus annuus]|nr:hypothetical protein HanPSC8_Chr14g0641731 [Helianthus annuus]
MEKMITGELLSLSHRLPDKWHTHHRKSVSLRTLHQGEPHEVFSTPFLT